MEVMLFIAKELLPMVLAAVVAYFIGFAEGFKQSAEKCKEILDKQLDLIFGTIKKDLEEMKGESHEEDNV